jgi:hypothetical protein
VIGQIALLAQLAAASLTGTVADGEGRLPLAGATVSLSDIGRSVMTDERGRYFFANVPAGPQHVSVRRVGYAARTLHAIVPGAGTLAIDVSLARLSITLSEVTVLPPVLPALRGAEDEAASHFPGRGLSMSAVRNHPLLAEPDVLQALSGGGVLMQPEAPRGFHVRGGASEQTAHVVDGFPILNPYHAAGTFSALNADALEEIHLSAQASSPHFPDALSGTVEAITREPDSWLRISGGASTTHARLTADGPLGGGANFLLSVRSVFPGFAFTASEPTYLRGEAGDVLGKVSLPLLGGEMRALLYNNANEFSAHSVAESPEDATVGAPRQEFAWQSRTAGASWARKADGVSFRVQAWSANADAGAYWNPLGGGPIVLSWERKDAGVLAHVDVTGLLGGRTSYGAWLQRSDATYSTVATPAEGGSARFSRGSPTTFAGLSFEHERSLLPDVELRFGVGALSAAGVAHFNPRAALTWTPSAHFALSGGYSRSTQFMQSLRNPESIAGSLFPVDLLVATGSSGEGPAHADQGAVAVEFRGDHGVQAGAQVFARALSGLLLVAPATGEPFSAGELTTGRAQAVGASLDFALRRPRYGVLASYGWQHVRMKHDGGAYAPEHGVSHVAEGGVIVFPSPTLSIRLGATAAAGRSSSALATPLEWESCNMFDMGCEFAGAPRYEPGAQGATHLPVYVRADLGVRKHWHVTIAGRDAEVAAFGSMSNLFGWKNVLALARDATTGELAKVEMRSFAPLVFGIDWRY